MADDALPIQGTWTPPTPPTPGGAAASAPTVGDAPAVVQSTGTPSAGAASAVTGAWSAPTPPTPGGAADAAPTVGDAPSGVVPTGAPSAGAASAVTGAWSAPTPPTPGGAAASAPTVGDAPSVVDEYVPPTAYGARDMPAGEGTLYPANMAWIPVTAPLGDLFPPEDYVGYQDPTVGAVVILWDAADGTPSLSARYGLYVYLGIRHWVLEGDGTLASQNETEIPHTMLYEIRDQDANTHITPTTGRVMEDDQGGEGTLRAPLTILP